MSIETYVSEFSKYVIALIAFLYSMECVLCLTLKKEERRRRVYMRQTILVFAMHFSGFLVICFETGRVRYLVFYALQQVMIFMVLRLYRHLYPDGSRLVVNNMCMLMSISFVMLTRLSYAKALRQFVIGGTGMFLSLLIPFLIHKLKILKSLKWVYGLVGVVLLGIVLILGQTTNGSKLTYEIAGIMFQPSEFVKITFIFYVAAALYKSESLFEIFTTAVIAGMHVVIQVLNKDLGSALIFFIIYITMVYVATAKFYYLLIGLAGGAGASALACRAFSHVQKRIIAWQDPFKVIDGVGYQITQSLFGISSGGLFGLGLFKGAPSAIPFVEDDFIFSAIAEEFGIIFSVCLILICLTTFLAMMRISNALKDKFYQLLAFGIGIAYIFQVFLTIGGGTKFVPLTGVTLPLVSYGGSSLLTTIIMFGIVEGMYLIRKDEVLEAMDRRAMKRKEQEARKEAARMKRKDERQKEEAKEEERREKKKEERRKEREEERREKKEERREEKKEERREKKEEKKRRAEEDRKKIRYDEIGSDEYEDPQALDYYEEDYDPEDIYEDEKYAYEEEGYREPGDDIEFLHGFTRPVDTEKVRERLADRQGLRPATHPEKRTDTRSETKREKGTEKLPEKRTDAKTEKQHEKRPDARPEEKTEKKPEVRRDKKPAGDEWDTMNLEASGEDGEDFPFEEIGEIYYNEEEFNRDKAAEAAKKKEE